MRLCTAHRLHCADSWVLLQSRDSDQSLPGRSLSVRSVPSALSHCFLPLRFQHAHHAKVSPSFCKRYASIGSAIQTALNEYKKDVSANDFPSDQYSPYKLLNDEEKDKFKRFAEDSYKRIEEQAAAKAKAKGTTSGAKATNTKEQAAAFEETIKVY